MKSTDRLNLARQLMAGANSLLDSDVVEAKRDSHPHDPFVNELGEILGGKLGPVVSGLLDKNFPGAELAKMREAIRIGTVNAFRKSLKLHFNNHYVSMIPPALKKEVEKSQEAKEDKKEKKEPEKEPEKSEKKEASEKKENGEPKPTTAAVQTARTRRISAGTPNAITKEEIEKAWPITKKDETSTMVFNASRKDTRSKKEALEMLKDCLGSDEGDSGHLTMDDKKIAEFVGGYGFNYSYKDGAKALIWDLKDGNFYIGSLKDFSAVYGEFGKSVFVEFD